MNNDSQSADEMVLPRATDAVSAFHVTVPVALLGDLRRRLAQTRYPDQEISSGRNQGVTLAKAKELVAHWRDLYDWRRFEVKINAFPQFRTRIDGLGFHFLHIRSRHADALPIILTHGWPGCFIEFLKVIEPLTDPTRHGGGADDAFHVIIPSLPGHGFSDKPTDAGWNLPRIAHAWSVLMDRLGYARYVAQGGNWGAGITTLMAKQRSPGLCAIHLNQPIFFPPPPPGPNGYAPEETAMLDQVAKYANDGGGYARIQGSRPQTLGYGLADSPIGQAMWIYEKFVEWIDGDPEQVVTRDEMLDVITLHWFCNTGASSARLYWEEAQTNDFTRSDVPLPVAVTIFKGDMFTPPKIWGQQTYSDLIYWNEVPKGGHFPAFEQPELFTAELRLAFAAQRNADYTQRPRKSAGETG